MGVIPEKHKPSRVRFESCASVNIHLVTKGQRKLPFFYCEESPGALGANFSAPTNPTAAITMSLNDSKMYCSTCMLYTVLTVPIAIMKINDIKAMILFDEGVPSMS